MTIGRLISKVVFSLTGMLLLNSADLLGQATGASKIGRMPTVEVKENRPDIQSDPKMFLEPIPVYEPSGYIFALFRTFFGRSLPVLSMVSPASMLKGPETAVLLLEESTGKVSRWFLEYAVADARIDDWELSSAQKSLDRGITATRTRVEIPKDFAAKLVASWSAVLSGVRLQPRGWAVWDGSAVFFQCRDEFGQAQFPGTSGAPAKLAELGSKLYRLPQLESSKQTAAIKECIALADKIIEITKTP